MAIAERLAEVRGRLARACDRAGRDPATVRLVAVSKTRTVAEMREAWEAGQRDFGENRLQEAEDKCAAGLPEGLRLHLVGHLQSNKARAAARIFPVIHSIDRLDLLARLDRSASGPIDGLVQVDLAGEPTKHGARPEEVAGILAAARGLGHLRLVGLMTLPPLFDDPEQARPYFRRLRELRDALGGPGVLAELSMGMSHDFEVAVGEGATLVRIGEAIFGPRRPPPARLG